VNNQELKIAIAFAQLELLELENGRRPLNACPGVENVARAIAEAKRLSEYELLQLDLLRAHALAGALKNARPELPDHQREYSQWVGCVRHVASVVCTAQGLSLDSFYTLAGVDS